MENNASSAGVLRGGLFNTTEIKILICYILTTIGEPVPINMLINVLHMEGIANGFEVSDAVMALTNSGQLVQADMKDDTYTVTESGRSVAKELNTSLSLTVKDRAYVATLKMFTRFKNSKDTNFEITHEDGATYLTCSAQDGKRTFLSIKILLADESQAGFIKERFLDNPSEIFSKVMEMLIK